MGVEKTDLKCFRLILKNHRLQAKECVFIGDSEAADMKPAQKMGMLTIHTHEFSKKPSKKFASISSLDLIEKLLE